jgi:tetratricopeptide (TPR) repeat protein
MNDRFDARYARAELLFKRGQTAEAEKELRLLLASGGASGEVHGLLALCAVREGDIEVARSHVKEALSTTPDSPGVHYIKSIVEIADLEVTRFPILGIVPEDLSPIRKSVKSVKEALRLDPGFVEAHARLSELYQMADRWKDSLEAAERGLQVEPTHVGCSILRAEALIRLGRRAEAADMLRQTLQENPEAAEAHSGFGLAMLRAGEVETAEALFREAARLDATDEAAEAGLLECAKYRYWLYRMLSRATLWIEAKPLFARAAVLCGFVLTVGLVVIWPMIRFASWTRETQRWTAVPYLCFAVLVMSILGLLFHDFLFLWLARKNALGEASTTQKRGFWVAHLALVGIALMVVLIIWGFQLLPGRVSGALVALVSACYAAYLCRSVRIGRWLNPARAYAILALLGAPIVGYRWGEYLASASPAIAIIAVFAIPMPLVWLLRLQEKQIRAERRNQRDAGSS